MLGQNDFRSKARTVGPVLALANPVESVAGGDHPCAGGGTVQILAEVFEYGGMFGWNCREVVECFVNAGCEACGRHVVAQYPLIHHLSEEARLGRQFVEHVRDILLPFGGKGLLIPGSSAKGNDDDFPLLRCSLSMHEWAAADQGSSERQSSGTAQKIAPPDAKVPGKVMWRGYR